ERGGSGGPVRRVCAGSCRGVRAEDSRRGGDRRSECGLADGGADGQAVEGIGGDAAAVPNGDEPRGSERFDYAGESEVRMTNVTNIKEGARRTGDIAIGRSTDGPVSISPMTLVDTRMLVQANSGGGKSWLLRLLAERAAPATQTIILDPEGE